MNEIRRVAKENNCEVINILDKDSVFYECGPSEFLYLEKHAFLICTDSFHSSVFAILYNRPFIVFDREEENVGNMNSRLETLISKLELKNRKYKQLDQKEAIKFFVSRLEYAKKDEKYIDIPINNVAVRNEIEGMLVNIIFCYTFSLTVRYLE